MGAIARMPGPLPLLGVFPQAEVEPALAYMDFLGIAQKAQERVFRLSGGERQRVAIARTLLQHPKIVFADEFVSDLDLPRAAQILRAMRELGRRENIAFVINLHEIPLVQEIGEQVVILKEGKLVYQGKAHEISLSLVQGVLA